MTDWITDCRPTEADGDGDGDVRVRYSPVSEDYSYLHWSHVGAGVPWKHCADWKPITTPVKFVAVSRTISKDDRHTIDAIDDEGVAWWMVSGETGWQRLADLPAREVVPF